MVVRNLRINKLTENVLEGPENFEEVLNYMTGLILQNDLY